jgi:hypothetical protein
MSSGRIVRSAELALFPENERDELARDGAGRERQAILGGFAQETRKSKLEIRNKFQMRNTEFKTKHLTATTLEFHPVGLVSNFEFRISDLWAKAHIGVASRGRLPNDS